MFLENVFHVNKLKSLKKLPSNMYSLRKKQTQILYICILYYYMCHHFYLGVKNNLLQLINLFMHMKKIVWIKDKTWIDTCAISAMDVLFLLSWVRNQEIYNILNFFTSPEGFRFKSYMLLSKVYIAVLINHDTTLILSWKNYFTTIIFQWKNSL